MATPKKEALKNAQEVLELLVESAIAEDKPLPTPKTCEETPQVA